MSGPSLLSRVYQPYNIMIGFQRTTSKSTYFLYKTVTVMLTITGFVYHVINISSSTCAQIWTNSIPANLIITTRVIIEAFIHIWRDWFAWLSCLHILKTIPLHRNIPSSCTSLNPSLHPQRLLKQKQLGSDMSQVGSVNNNINNKAQNHSCLRGSLDCLEFEYMSHDPWNWLK